MIHATETTQPGPLISFAALIGNLIHAVEQSGESRPPSRSQAWIDATTARARGIRAANLADTLAVIAEHGPISNAEISRRMERSDSVICDRCKALRLAGKIENVGSGLRPKWQDVQANA